MQTLTILKKLLLFALAILLCAPACFLRLAAKTPPPRRETLTARC